jgi:cytochrome c oxidase subunit 3
VKYAEYSHKFHDGLLPGARFHPTEQVWETQSFKHKHPAAAEYAERLTEEAKAKGGEGAEPKAAEATPHAAGAEAVHAKATERVTEEELEPLIAAGVLGEKAENPTVPSKPRNAHVFFSIYFFMTGLHGIHVLAGIGVWVWLLLRARKGVFNSMYFGPIDYAALYWHLVDLIWIYLFPLLYLSH